MVVGLKKPMGLPGFSLSFVDSDKRLDELYAIDCEAYGAHNISRDRLCQWVAASPSSLPIVLHQDRIVAAFGLFAISEEQIRHLIGGQICEEDLRPLGDDIELHRFWYFSGIVVVPEFQRRRHGPLRTLFWCGLDSWVSSDRVGYQGGLRVAALAVSQQGINLLDRFGFDLVKQGEDLPDGVPLYCRTVDSAKTIRNAIKEKVA